MILEISNNTKPSLISSKNPTKPHSEVEVEVEIGTRNADMATRLRRAVFLARAFSSTSSSWSTIGSRRAIVMAASSGSGPSRPPPAYRLAGMRFRVSSSGSVYSPIDANDTGKREPLFPGCDYNHWLVTMEFPDPNTTREQKIETFINTLANVVGGVDKAKQKIYALSTTRYTGFMCEISEELSEKIKKEPGVEWVLPDSYADPHKKTYGVGDLYINGEIIPDPNPLPKPSMRDRPRNRRRDSLPVERNTNQPAPQQGPPQNYSHRMNDSQYSYSQNYRPPMNQQSNPPQQQYNPAQQPPPMNQQYNPAQQSPAMNQHQPSSQNYRPMNQQYPPPGQNYNQYPSGQGQSYNPVNQQYPSGQGQNYNSANQQYPPGQGQNYNPVNQQYPPQQSQGPPKQEYRLPAPARQPQTPVPNSSGEHAQTHWPMEESA